MTSPIAWADLAFRGAEPHSGTSYSEQNAKVTIRPVTGEVVCLYVLDTAAVREALKLKKCCDVGVAWALEERRGAVLVELKGRHVGHAAEQLAETANAVYRQIPAGVRRVAAVVSGGASPSNRQAAEDKFMKLAASTGFEFVVRTRVLDLAQLLRVRL